MEERHALEQYLRRVLGAPVELLAVHPLKGTLGEEEDPKGFGYGAPLEVECLVNHGPGADFSVLDRSRGEWGEPADDVAALTINYLFFGLLKENAAESFHRLFVRFFDAYLDETGDRDLFELLPPFYLFRALVLAHPLWYPEIPDRVRIALLRFATAMGEPRPFDLAGLEAICRGAS